MEKEGCGYPPNRPGKKKHERLKEGRRKKEYQQKKFMINVKVKKTSTHRHERLVGQGLRP